MTAIGDFRTAIVQLDAQCEALSAALQQRDALATEIALWDLASRWEAVEHAFLTLGGQIAEPSLPITASQFAMATARQAVIYLVHHTFMELAHWSPLALPLHLALQHVAEKMFGSGTDVLRGAGRPWTYS